MTTLEVEFMLNQGAFGRGMVPSKTSTGEHETVELRTTVTNLVTVVLELKKAVDNVNNIIAETIIGYDVRPASY